MVIAVRGSEMDMGEGKKLGRRRRRNEGKGEECAHEIIKRTGGSLHRIELQVQEREGRPLALARMYHVRAVVLDICTMR